MEKLLRFILFLIIPAMVLGQIVNIEVRNFKYEVSASEFLIVLLTIGFIIHRIAKKDLKIYLPVTVLFFAIYLFLAAFSVLWASDVSRTIIAFRVGIYHILAFVLALNVIKKKEDIRLMFYSFCVAAGLISIQLVYQVYQIGGFFTRFIPERSSITTPVGPWVTVSAIIIIMVPLVYSFGLIKMKEKKRLAFFFIGISVFSALASLLTLGKTELIALVGGIAFFNRNNISYFKSRYFTGNKDYFIKILTVSAIIILAGGAMLGPFLSGLGSRFLNTLNDQNTKFRVREYQLTAQALKENFFTGVGAGNLKVYFRNKGLCQCYTEASNYITQFWGELGLMGLLLLAAGSRSIYKSAKSFNSIKYLSDQDKLIILSLKTSLVIFLINGLFESTIVGLNYGIVFWIIIGALLALEKILKREYEYLPI